MSVAEASTIKFDSPMTMTSRLLVTALLGFATCASAQSIFRCDEGGRVTYTNRSCERGMAARIEIAAAPPPDTVKIAAARLQAAVAEFDTRHAAGTSGGELRALESASARSQTLGAGRTPVDDSVWCIVRHGDAGRGAGDIRHVNLLVSVPRRR